MCENCFLGSCKLYTCLLYACAVAVLGRMTNYLVSCLKQPSVSCEITWLMETVFRVFYRHINTSTDIGAALVASFVVL